MTATDFSVFVGHSCCTGSNIRLEGPCFGINAVLVIFTQTQTTNQTFTMRTRFSLELKIMWLISNCQSKNGTFPHVISSCSLHNQRVIWGCIDSNKTKRKCKIWTGLRSLLMTDNWSHLVYLVISDVILCTFSVGVSWLRSKAAL